MDEEEDLQGLEDQGPSQEAIEREARELGWVPQDKFRGNKDKWVPAEEFLEKGKNLLPILRSTNDRLKGQLAERDRRLDAMAAQVENANTAIARLNEHWSNANKQAVARAKEQLKEELKTAREEGDTDSELQILDKLHELREAEKTPEPKPAAKPTPTPKDSAIAPENQAWFDARPWFGGDAPEDKKKSKAYQRIAEDLRDDGSDLKGVEFLDEVERIYEEKNGGEAPPQTRRTSKTGTPTPQARSTSQSSAKGWNDLPAEAKQACMEFADSVVGPGKTYKTVDEWKKEYAKTYHGQ